MSFNDELLKDGRGRALRIDGSLDKFSTVTYRWGDKAGFLDGSNMYTSRVLSVAPVRRGFGQQRIAAGGSSELVLDNADGELDGLCGRENISTQAKLRLRIYVVLFDPAASSPTFTSKLLGEFSLMEWSRQDNSTVTLSLGDDVIGAVSQQTSLPTFNDWAVLGTSATNPLLTGYSLPETVVEFSPIQLAFGEDWVLALPHVLPFGPVHANYQGKIIVPVCTTSDTGAGSAGEITSLRILWANPSNGSVQLFDVPQTVWNGASSTSREAWRVERSPTITKDGKTFKIVYLVVDAALGVDGVNANYLAGYSQTQDPVLAASYSNPLFANEFIGGYSPNAVMKQREYAGNRGDVPQYGRYGAGVLAWFVQGVPLSARTQTSNPVQHPVDVLTDLVDYYSNNTEITVNATAAARVKAGTRMAACSGTVQPWQMGPRRGDPTFQQPPSLRQTITAICQSSDIDIFIDWSGQFSFSADLWDFRVTSSSSGWASVSPDGAVQSSGDGLTTTYTPSVIPETWLSNMERWVPSQGERWAPYNRLWFNGARTSPADNVNVVPYQGPFDFFNVEAAVNLSDRVIEASLEQGWRPFRQQAQAPWFWRQLNTQARDMIRFRTHIGGLQLDLGDYFLLGWSRGPQLGGPYSLATAFQVEGITYSPGDDIVEVTAVWRDDVTTERQYLLDDESILNFPGLTLTGAAVSNDTGGIQLAGGCNIGSLSVGSILELKDSTQAADVFTRFGTWRITAFDNVAKTLTLALNTNGDYPAAGSIAAGEWRILYGATLEALLQSNDPGNYPLGAAPYGKIVADDTYSNGADGNRLITG